MNKEIADMFDAFCLTRLNPTIDEAIELTKTVFKACVRKDIKMPKRKKFVKHTLSIPAIDLERFRGEFDDTELIDAVVNEMALSSIRRAVDAVNSQQCEECGDFVNNSLHELPILHATCAKDSKYLLRLCIGGTPPIEWHILRLFQ